MDLLKAYRQFLLDENFKDFTAFKVGDNRYRYRTLPKGASCVPQVFIEWMYHKLKDLILVEEKMKINVLIIFAKYLIDLMKLD